jgi:hypothetical protein
MELMVQLLVQHYLLTLAFPCINGVTEVTQYHLRGYGHPNFLVALCALTLGM